MFKIALCGDEVSSFCEMKAAEYLAPMHYTFNVHSGNLFGLVTRLRHEMFNVIGDDPGEDDKFSSREGKYLDLIRQIERQLIRTTENVSSGVVFDGAFDETAMAVDELLTERDHLMGQVRNSPKYQVHNPSDPQVRAAVKALTDGLCTYCDAQLGDDWHIEHVVPRSAGGPDTLANYVPSCGSCNIAKHSLHVLEFIRRKQGRVPRPMTPVPVELRVVNGDTAE